jgi:chromosomal replication initiation ATPase DnaA
MTEQHIKEITTPLLQAWIQTTKARDLTSVLGHAAHKAGYTLRQHQLEVLHHNLDRTARELASTIAQFDMIKKGKANESI